MDLCAGEGQCVSVGLCILEASLDHQGQTHLPNHLAGTHLGQENFENAH